MILISVLKANFGPACDNHKEVQHDKQNVLQNFLTDFSKTASEMEGMVISQPCDKADLTKFELKYNLRKLKKNLKWLKVCSKIKMNTILTSTAIPIGKNHSQFKCSNWQIWQIMIGLRSMQRVLVWFDKNNNDHDFKSTRPRNAEAEVLKNWGFWIPFIWNIYYHFIILQVKLEIICNDMVQLSSHWMYRGFY